MNYFNFRLAFNPIDWILELFGKLLAFFNDITGGGSNANG